MATEYVLARKFDWKVMKRELQAIEEAVEQ